LLFQNWYNPFSPYLTAAINLIVLFALGVSSHPSNRLAPIALQVLVANFVIALWTILVFITQSSSEEIILLKYARNFSSTLLIAAIGLYFRPRTALLVQAAAAVFMVHVVLIGLQFLIPGLDQLTAQIFGFTRDVEIIAELQGRKLGATGGYDTASEFSIAAAVFCYLAHHHLKSNIYLLLSVLGFMATLASSRVGIFAGTTIFIIVAVHKFVKSGNFVRLAAIPGCLFGSYYLVNWMVPFVAKSLGIEGYRSTEHSAATVFEGYGGGGTFEALTSSHLDALNLPLAELLVGLGKDPNMYVGFESDIGYVKQIYHIGIIGTFAVLILYWLIWRRAVIGTKLRDPDVPTVVISQFLVFYIPLDLLMNYKALVTYSRGSYELVIIMALWTYNRADRKLLTAHVR
jgi:hypothetical protein